MSHLSQWKKLCLATNRAKRYSFSEEEMKLCGASLASDECDKGDV
jgi:hypothetical protein